MVGDDSLVMLDVNQQWTFPQALEHVRVAERDVTLLDRRADASRRHRCAPPARAGNLSRFRSRSASTCPTASLFKNFMQAGAVYFVQADCTRRGRRERVPDRQPAGQEIRAAGGSARRRHGPDSSTSRALQPHRHGPPGGLPRVHSPPSKALHGSRPRARRPLPDASVAGAVRATWWNSRRSLRSPPWSKTKTCPLSSCSGSV